MGFRIKWTNNFFTEKEVEKYEDLFKTHHFKYNLKEVVYADSWDDNRWEECSHGIHFLIDRQSAVNYY